uniref:Putative HNH homing endonuclease n=1 Tax=Hariotina sp. MMOGRB0030F TaxID=1867922 RepID=A0A2H4FU17_9CHLO|nr:putative HNH homing endonuclease [Hariotina sp. MMOGRB0030F]
MVFKLSQKFIQSKIQEVEAKAQLLNHSIQYNEYEIKSSQFFSCENKESIHFPSTRKAKLIIQCLKHETVQETTIQKYLRSRTGMICCGKEEISQKLSNRQFSKETREKMSKSRKLFHEQNKKNQTKTQQNRNRYNEWRQIALENANFQCSLTKIRPKKLDAHHLFSKKVFVSIEFDQENCVILAKEIHQGFHNYYGTLNIVTIDHFIEFLEILSRDQNFRSELFQTIEPRNNFPKYEQTISNPVSNNDTGSETTQFYNVENILELQKYMIRIREGLLKKLLPKEKILANKAFQTKICSRNFQFEEWNSDTNSFK